MSNVLTFPRPPESATPSTVFRTAHCPDCGGTRSASLQRTALARHVSWRCVTCGVTIRDRKGRAFIPHHELRACGIDPDNLPEVRRANG